MTAARLFSIVHLNPGRSVAPYLSISPPWRVVNIDGRVEASRVDNQVQFFVRYRGLPVVGSPWVQAICVGLDGSSPHIGVEILAASGLI